MFLTPEQTGGPSIFALRRHNYYLAVFQISDEIITLGGNCYVAAQVREFDIRELAQALGQPAGETWQEHEKVILLACCKGRLFEWLDKIGGGQC